VPGWHVVTRKHKNTMITSSSHTICNASTSGAYAAYVLAWDAALRAARGLPVADKATKAQGLEALIQYIDAEVASGRGAYCRVTVQWDGGEPSRTLNAAEWRAKAVADLETLEAGNRPSRPNPQPNPTNP
jgi:imidazole glycerol phosphate synthase subunit HisF